MPGKTKKKQSFPSYKILEQNLKSGVIESFYFFTGSQSFLKDQLITRIKKKLHISPGSINNLLLYPDSPGITDIFYELETQSFFSDNKIVILKNADKMPISILNQMKDILQRETLEAYIIFVSEKFPYRLNTRNLDKILSRTFMFEAQRRDFRAFLTQFLRQFHKRMTVPAQDIILEMYTDLYDLYHNVEKLAFASDDREIIDESDLTVLTTCSHHISSFTFLDELAARDVPQALLTLSELLSKGENFYSLIGLLRSQFLNLLKARQMLKQGNSPQAVCQKLGIFPFKRDQFIQQTQNFSLKKLFQNIKTLSRFDLLAKSSSLSAEHVMQMLVIELCLE